MNTSKSAVSCLGVIPARLQSVRLPEKPLKDIGGKTLLQRVWEQARRAKTVKRVVIATDSDAIREHAEDFGAEVLMTGIHHLTGSDRVAEAASLIEGQGQRFDLVANIQGDMPFIRPELIDRTIACLAQSDQNFGMGTVAAPMLDLAEFMRPSAVKVALANDGAALYFSRAPIPFLREPFEVKVSKEQPYGFKHMGLYVFRRGVLTQLATLQPSLPEMREKLEQLRALTGGIRIKVFVAEPELVSPSIEVDTPADLERAREFAQRDPALP